MTVAFPRRALLAVVAAAFVLAACARSVQVGSGPGPVYAVEVVNSLGQDMIVSYDDGGGARTLGTVPAGATERFIITAPARTTVSIQGRTSAGTQTSGPYSVQLSQTEASRVTLR
jgi:hypothetical protein